MNWNPDQIRVDFLRVARVAGTDIRPDDIDIETLEMPHRPTPLPVGKIAVFVFSDSDRVLKVSKVGPNSNARYQYQHYGVWRAPSTLAGALMRDGDAVRRHRLREENVGKWIKQNTDRVNFILDESYYHDSTQDLGSTHDRLKEFLLDQLRPVYEGRQES